jgi:muramoyltetrapeptide carboxypeptidase
LASAKILKAPALRQDDKVGLIAPAGSFSREAFLAGCERLRQMRYEPVYSPDIFDRDIYFAGTAERRARELKEYWQREDIRALVCVRGGYGSNYLLQHLDFNLIASQPKIFAGCSDITALLTAIHDRTGLVTFHAPMAAKDIGDGTIDVSSWKNSLGGTAEWDLPAAGMEVLRAGKAQGKLYGGCLSLLAASLGTRFAVETEDTLLFLEDIGERPYRIDRMLMQLRLAGKLEKVRGFIFGEMLGCEPPLDSTYTLQQVIMRVLAGYNVPVVFGLKSGHVTGNNITLPIGVQAELRAEGSSIELKVLEPATYREQQ